MDNDNVEDTRDILDKTMSDVYDIGYNDGVVSILTKELTRLADENDRLKEDKWRRIRIYESTITGLKNKIEQLTHDVPIEDYHYSQDFGEGSDE